MEKTKNKSVRKKRPVDVQALKLLMDEAGVGPFHLEKQLGIGNGILSRGMKPDTPRPIPPKWELPIIKYLKKKIQEKKEVEIQTVEVLQELGFKTPDIECDLKEDLKETKKGWVSGMGL